MSKILSRNYAPYAPKQHFSFMSQSTANHHSLIHIQHRLYSNNLWINHTAHILHSTPNPIVTTVSYPQFNPLLHPQSLKTRDYTGLLNAYTSTPISPHTNRTSLQQLSCQAHQDPYRAYKLLYRTKPINKLYSKKSAPTRQEAIPPC